METSLISVTEQLAIIRLARPSLINDIQNRRSSGLCYYLDEAIEVKYGHQLHDNYDYIKTYIPLFTYENAVQHANASSDRHWWWSYGSLYTGGIYDSINRMLFLDWMENDLLS